MDDLSSFIDKKEKEFVRCDNCGILVERHSENYYIGFGNMCKESKENNFNEDEKVSILCAHCLFFMLKDIHENKKNSPNSIYK